MERRRVVLANQPRLLRGMLKRVLAREPGLRVVGEVTNQTKLSSLVQGTKAQWVIVSLWTEGVAPNAVRALLMENSSLCVLGMAQDGSRVSILRKGASEEIRSGPSLDDLIAILEWRR